MSLHAWYDFVISFRAQTMSPDTEAFFTDAPLADPMQLVYIEHWARMVPPGRWANHAIVDVNGHCVWKPWADLQPADMLCFYDGDVHDVLAPDDPRLLTPKTEEPSSDELPRRLRPDWDEAASEVSLKLRSALHRREPASPSA